MKHLNLEQFQSLLEQEVTASEREVLVDHILDCSQCGTQFKALKSLKDACIPAAKPKPKIFRYSLGVAAVMVMALSPYLFQPQSTPVPSMELAQQLQSNHPTITFAVNQEVSRVNFNSAVINWSQEQDMLELVALQNRNN